MFITLQGREYALEPCGKAFMSLPGIHAASIDQINGHSTNLENLLSITSQVHSYLMLAVEYSQITLCENDVVTVICAKDFLNPE